MKVNPVMNKKWPLRTLKQFSTRVEFFPAFDCHYIK